MYKFDEESLTYLRKDILGALSNPRLTHERLELVTKSYNETKAYPTALRRAKALETVLGEMTIYIKDYEYIVGNLTPIPFSAAIFPEFSSKWILEELSDFEDRPGDHFVIPEETKDKIKEIIPGWQGNTVQDRAISLMSNEVLHARSSKLIGFENMFTGGIAHFVPRYEEVLEKGMNGIANEIKVKMQTLSATDPGDFLKITFYKAALLSCESACTYAGRFAELARNLSNDSKVKEDKLRFLKISEVCKRVPAEPARTFHEALQALWFTQIICYMEQNGLAVTLGRMDQYLFPFYQQDIKNGVINRDEAKALLVAFWVKCNEILKLYNNIAANYYAGFPITQAPQCGGFLSDGSDATNELSEIILEAESLVRLPQPDIAVLWTAKMSDSFLQKAAKVVPESMKPKFFNAEVGMKHLLGLGATFTEARDYAFAGCVESTIPGKTWGWHNAGMINLAKCLELVFTQGIDTKSGLQLGVATTALSEIKSFAKFYEAFALQVENAVRLLVSALYAIESAHRDLMPLPFESLLVKDCIEKGLDLNNGGAKYNFMGIQAVGLATVADSLIAVQETVFKQKRWSLDGLCEMMRNDYNGKELERQYLLNKLPKFGNDSDDVDLLARKVGCTYCDIVTRFKNLRWGKFIPGFFSISAHVPFGQGVLTCDGRKMHEPISDGSSPGQGRANKGPTAIAASLGKIDHLIATNGTLLNVKFNANLFAKEQNIANLSSYIQSFMEMGGFHMQINVVNPQVLRGAQKNPEQYPDLLVRVAAYVALFTQLSREIQDEIISRSELGL